MDWIKTSDRLPERAPGKKYSEVPRSRWIPRQRQHTTRDTAKTLVSINKPEFQYTCVSK
jgi:hypothetical protein